MYRVLFCWMLDSMLDQGGCPSGVLKLLNQGSFGCVSVLTNGVLVD